MTDEKFTFAGRRPTKLTFAAVRVAGFDIGDHGRLNCGCVVILADRGVSHSGWKWRVRCDACQRAKRNMRDVMGHYGYNIKKIPDYEVFLLEAFKWP